MGDKLRKLGISYLLPARPNPTGQRRRVGLRQQLLDTQQLLCLHAAAKHPSRLLRSNPDLTLAPYATIGDARKAVAAFLRRL